MNTSVHIPKDLSDRLTAFLTHNQIPKNQFIVEAIAQRLEELEDKEAWHPDILNWQGIPGEELEIERFEAGLLPMQEITLLETIQDGGEEI